VSDDDDDDDDDDDYQYVERQIIQEFLTSLKALVLDAINLRRIAS